MCFATANWDLSTTVSMTSFVNMKLVEATDQTEGSEGSQRLCIPFGQCGAELNVESLNNHRLKNLYRKLLKWQFIFTVPFRIGA